MTKQSNGNVVHSVKSNQEDIYKNLEAVVRKYAATTFLRPVADHTREAFEQASEFVRSFYGSQTTGRLELVLDSGCGTGESTLHLAKKFPNVRQRLQSSRMFRSSESTSRRFDSRKPAMNDSSKFRRAVLAMFRRMPSGCVRNCWTFGA